MDCQQFVENVLFQSTHPVRGATMTTKLNTFPVLISIHAPREGCDASRKQAEGKPRNFNPRTP